MKLLTNFLILTLSISSYAGNLLVKEYGVNGTFASIQSAIDASSPNDTIIVFPKPSGLDWIESINMVHPLVFRHSDESSDFNLLKGSINVYASSNQVYYFENSFSSKK